MAAIERIEIPVGDFVFDARVAGPSDGELVVLLHGFPQTSLEWRAQLPPLGDAGYRAGAPAPRGYSRRAPPRGAQPHRAQPPRPRGLALAPWPRGHPFPPAGPPSGAAGAWPARR